MSEQNDRRIVKMRHFEQIEIGETAELSHVITKEDVEAFANLTGDYNPLHVDENFARQTAFQKPVVHGMLSASFISTMIGMLLPGGGALWVSQTLNFLQPSRIGDEICVKASVKQKSLAARTIVLDIVISNQFEQKLITGQSTVKLLEITKKVETMNVDERKTVLVTGGGRGIGAAVARRLASEGHRVVIDYYHSSEAAQQLVTDIINDGGAALALQADVSNEEQMGQLFTTAAGQFSPIQALVHCAAPHPVPTAFDELSWDVVQEHFDIQVKGAFNCAKLALPAMVEHNTGDIVFIGSIFTDSAPPTQQTHYIMAKSALMSLARSLAVEYGPKGVHVNIISPGMTQTDMIADLPDKVKMLTKMQTPLRQLADPSDIAGTAAFLLSRNARHINGETIRVCGGIVMV